MCFLFVLFLIFFNIYLFTKSREQKKVIFPFSFAQFSKLCVSFFMCFFALFSFKYGYSHRISMCFCMFLLLFILSEEWKLRWDVNFFIYLYIIHALVSLFFFSMGLVCTYKESLKINYHYTIPFQLAFFILFALFLFVLFSYFQ